MQNKIINETDTTDVLSNPILLDTVKRTISKRSLAASVSDIRPLRGPMGVVFGIVRDKANNKFAVKKRDVQTVSRTIPTILTKEVVDDFSSMFSENIIDFVSTMLSDEIIKDIDADFINFLSVNARILTPLSYSQADFGGQLDIIASNIITKVIKERNKLIKRNKAYFHCWAIVTPNIQTALQLTDIGIELSTNELVESLNYIGAYKGIDFYVNPYKTDSEVDDVYIGIVGNKINGSSTVFSPYTNSLLSTVNENGEEVYFFRERSGFSLNPLDLSNQNGLNDSDYIVKFEVDLTDFKDW